MTYEELKFVGKGVYSIGDAMAFTGLSYAKVRHWVRGDLRSGKFNRPKTDPIIKLRYGKIEGEYVLSFLDLVELLMIKELNEYGITIRAIRSMHKNAMDQFHHTNPFAFEELYTAGRDIIAKVYDETGDSELLNLRNNNLELKEITKIHLKNIDFLNEDKISQRWWPVGRKRNIVIDPERSFGHPIDNSSGIPTIILAQSVNAEGSFKNTADWYNVEIDSVKEAYYYETEKIKRIKKAA